MIADYYFVRNQKLHVNELYEKRGQYGYMNGFNRIAIIALLLGILPNVPGFLTTVGAVNKESVWTWASEIYHYAWFVGFFVSGCSYLVMMRRALGVRNSESRILNRKTGLETP